MTALKFAGAAAVFALLTAGAAEAAMTPSHGFASRSVQRVDCAVGFHLGPMGACVIGTDDDRAAPPPAVIERRATDEGCETRSVRRTAPDGASETHTATNCD